MEAPTHYDTLQVAENASEEVIKGAYRSLSQKLHPDRNPQRTEEAEHDMRVLNKAYAVLSDPMRRREYDKWLAGQRAGGNASFDEDAVLNPAWKRDQYVNEIIDHSGETLNAMFFFFGSLVCVVAASISSDLRVFFFGSGFVRFGLVLLVISAVIGFAVSYNRKNRLKQEDLADLEQIHKRYKLKKKANIVLAWAWLLLTIAVLYAYRESVLGEPAQSLASPVASRAPVSQQALPFILSNQCDHALLFLVNYQEAENRWVTAGPYTVQPGVSSRLVLANRKDEFIMLRSGLLYYYAKTADDAYVWQGRETNPQDKSVVVGDHLFRFRATELQPAGQDAYKLTLTCDHSG